MSYNGQSAADQFSVHHDILHRTRIFMSDKPSDTLYWTDVYLRGQEEFLSQWSKLGVGGATTSANPFGAAPNTAWGKTPWGTDWSAMFMPQFHGPAADVAQKYFGFFEQYVGASRAFAELIAKISANPDPSARAQEFTAGLAALQQPFAKMWHSMVSEQSGAAMPALGLTREHQEANDRIRKLFTDLQQQQLTLSSMWSDIIAEALRAFGEKAGARLRTGESFPSIKVIYDLWIECAELAYAKAAHSPAYAKAQADMGNTMAHLRIEQRKQVEAISKQLDLPTRDELNTVHRRLKDLKTELRALQTQLRAAKASANTTAPIAKKKSAAKGAP
jgi:hypothetical protein